MKILITNYTFNALDQEIIFPGYGSVSLASFLIIFNVETNEAIYNFADPLRGGSVAGNVLSLTYDTTGMSDPDQLLIYYDDPDAVGGLPTDAATESTLALIEVLLGTINSSVGNIPGAPATEQKQNDTITELGEVNAVLGLEGASAVITDTTGTISGKLRGMVKIFASVWDQTNSWLNVRRVKNETFGTPTAFTITLASLANSTANVGRQSTLITGNTAESALIGVKIRVGTTPTINSTIYIYLIRGDGTLADDMAGSSDAALTVKNAPLLGTITVPATTSDTDYSVMLDTKFLGSLGPTFGVAVVNSSGVALNSTGGNHVIEYTKIT